jgi:hypothetical protein
MYQILALFFVTAFSEENSCTLYLETIFVSKSYIFYNQILILIFNYTNVCLLLLPCVLLGGWNLTGPYCESSEEAPDWSGRQE